MLPGLGGGGRFGLHRFERLRRPGPVARSQGTEPAHEGIPRRARLGRGKDVLRAFSRLDDPGRPHRGQAVPRSARRARLRVRLHRRERPPRILAAAELQIRILQPRERVKAVVAGRKLQALRSVDRGLPGGLVRGHGLLPHAGCEKDVRRHVERVDGRRERFERTRGPGACRGEHGRGRRSSESGNAPPPDAPGSSRRLLRRSRPTSCRRRSRACPRSPRSAPARRAPTRRDPPETARAGGASPRRRPDRGPPGRPARRAPRRLRGTSSPARSALLPGAPRVSARAVREPSGPPRGPAPARADGCTSSLRPSTPWRIPARRPGPAGILPPRRGTRSCGAAARRAGNETAPSATRTS